MYSGSICITTLTFGYYKKCHSFVPIVVSHIYCLKLRLYNKTMATRPIIEPLPVNSDRSTITNWIKRLTAGIEVALFNCDEKLPKEPAEKAEMMEKLKKNYLIASIGGPGLTELTSLTAPEEPEDKSFDDLIKMITEHYAPTPNKITEEYKFGKICQDSSETLTSFFTRIKTGAHTCGFGDKYDQMIRNRFICGLRDAKIRDELLDAEDNSTANQIYEKARKKEMNLQAGTAMGSSQQNVNYVNGKTGTNAGKPNNKGSNKFKKTKSTVVCSKCTLSGHIAENCKIKCSYCKKPGHIVKNCKKKSKKNVHHMETEDDVNTNLGSSVNGNESHGYMYFVEVSEDLSSDLPVHSQPLLSEKLSTNSSVPDLCVLSDVETPSEFLMCVTSSQSDVETPSEFPVCETGSALDDEAPSEFLVRETSSASDVETPSEFLVCENSELLVHVEPSSEFAVHVEPCSKANDCLCQSNKFDLNCLNDTKIEKNELPNTVNFSRANSEMKGNKSKPMVNVSLNGKDVHMEVDTGAAVSCMSRANFDRLSLPGCVLSECNINLCVANGQTVKSICRATVNVKYQNLSCALPLYIVDSAFPTLLGLEWINSLFGAGWFERMTDSSCSVNLVQSRQEFIDKVKTSKVFDPGMGLITGYEANIDLKPNAKPVFCKFRQPPFAHVEAIGKTIDQLVSEGILVKVDYSDYASPVMPVIKPNGEIRLCGDYKRTLNPNIDTAVYPLPVMEDCLWNVRGGELFTKLDIKGAYNQVPVRDEDQILLTINTHKGLYKFTRLPYGVSSASAIFQSIMDRVLEGMQGVICRVDDILVTGKNDAQHMSNLEEVVSRLEKAGFRCRVEKCVFMQPEVEYIGHRISKLGCRPLDNKVDTIVKAPYPKTREEMISFLGMIQYYSRYLPDLHTVIEPLNRLRSKSISWEFGDKEKASFDQLKTLISSERVLTFYNPELPLRLDTDASKVGLGAVLSHVVDGVDKPIEFISRTLKPAERNYSQIEKEALGIVWAVRRFHRYLYAREFILCTDHKPLEMIFDPFKSLSEVVSTRIQRWGIFLTSYRYTVQFRPTTKHANADMCSRFPLPHKEERESDNGEDIFFVDDEFSILSIVIGDDKPLLDCSVIAKATKIDPVLAKVTHYVLEGWTEQIDRKSSSTEDPEMKAYRTRQSELTLEGGCLLWGARVIIPQKMRKSVLDMLHSTHMGVSSMKSLSRGYVWWPGLDGEIERVTKTCEACCRNQRMPNRSVPHPWVAPSGPWERIHVDFAGPFMGYMWLLTVCAYSKWLEVTRMRIGGTKSKDTIKALRDLFCRFGLPQVCVSDGGPQFASDEFDAFMKKNGITHIPTPPYHPASNGQVESTVKSFKTAMKKMKHTNPDIMLNLQNWLMSYRNTPHSTTGVEPGVLMIGRRARSALSLLHPLHQGKRKSHLAKEQTAMQKETAHRQFVPGEKVWYWDQFNTAWKRGVVIQLQGTKVLEIEGETGNVRKHLDHVVHDHTVAPKPLNLSHSDQPEPGGAENQCTEKSRGDLTVEHGIKPKFEESSHEPSLESKNSETCTPESVKTDSSLSKILPNERPKRKISQPSRLTYDKLGG